MSLDTTGRRCRVARHRHERRRRAPRRMVARCLAQSQWPHRPDHRRLSWCSAGSVARGFTPYGPDAQNPKTVLKGISLAHFMGTDQFGRDVFSGALQGLGVSLEIAFLSVLIAGVIGTLGGIVAGFFGKWTSATIMRVTDMMFAIPTVLFALAIVTALGPSILDSSIAIGVGWIPIYVRVVRSPGPGVARVGLRARGSSSRLLAFSTAVSPHLAERDGRHRRPDQPRPRLGDPRRGELEFPRSRPAPADCSPWARW